MLSFWDTVRGRDLAETLIRELPKLTGRKKQEIVRLSQDDAVSYIEDKIFSGKARVVTSYSWNDETFVVLEER